MGVSHSYKFTNTSVKSIPFLNNNEKRGLLLLEKAPTYLKLRVSNSSKKWYFHKSVHNKQRKIFLGNFPDVDCNQAEQLARDTLTKFQNNDVVFSPTRKKKLHFLDEAISTDQNTSLGALLELRIEKMKEKNIRSWDEWRSVLNRYIKNPYPEIWNHPANELEAKHFLTVLEDPQLKDKKYPRNKVISYLKTAYNEACNPVELRYSHFNIKYNPVAPIRKEREKPEEIISLSTHQYQTLFKHLDDLPDRFRIYGKILALTGQRIEQIMAVKKKDFYPMAEIPYLYIFDGKGRGDGRDHSLPLTKTLMSLINELNPFQSDYLFEHENASGEMEWMKVGSVINNNIFKPISRKMIEDGDWDREPFTYKVIRATVSSRAVQYGVSQEIEKRLLSHGYGGVVDRHYLDYNFNKQKLEALEIIEKVATGQIQH